MIPGTFFVPLHHDRFGRRGGIDVNVSEKNILFSEHQRRHQSAGGGYENLAIGLTVALDIMFGGPLTGAAMNPARTFGPALASGHWNNHIVYWVGPLAGGARRNLITFVKDRPGHDRRYAIDATKLEGELDWRARDTFETGLRRTVQWYLDRRDEQWDRYACDVRNDIPPHLDAEDSSTGTVAATSAGVSSARSDRSSSGPIPGRWISVCILFSNAIRVGSKA